MMETVSRKYQSLLICLVLAVLVLTAYEPVRHNEFVDYDDKVYIVTNPHIQFGFTAQSLSWAFTTGYGANWYPLTWLSHLLDMELFGLNPLGHHIHNVLLHTAAVLLLFWILRSMTGNIWCSVFAAAVFGIHPLRVESVAWAAERKDVLCAVFWMLTIWAYIVYTRREGFLRYLFTLLCLALALMAKPMAVTLPLVLLLLDVWPLNRFEQNRNLKLSKPAGDKRAGKKSRQRENSSRSVSTYWFVVEKIPFFILIVISSVITYLVQQKGGAVDATQLTWYMRLTNIPISYVRYLYKTFWPVDLAVLYPFPKDGWPFWQAAGAAVFLIGLSIVALYNIKKRPFLFVGWFWYMITLVPVIGLVQVGNQSMADRYSYLPSIGILMMLAWGFGQWAPAWRYRNGVYAALGVISIIIMIILSRIQVAYWQDTLTHYQHTVSVTQDNYIIYNNLASVYLQEGKLDKASEFVDKALAILPGFCLANINKAILLKDQKHYDQALAHINEVLTYADSQWQVHLARGEILEAMQKFNEALQSYKKAIELNGDESSPFYKAGLILAKQGSLQEAIYYFEQALRRTPGRIDIYRDLGQAKQFLNQWDEAIAIYQKALSIEPEDHTMLYRLGYCLEKQGKLSAAVSRYRLALQRRPDYLPVINQLVLILATASDSSIRNPSEAIQLAVKGCQVTSYKDFKMLNVLAAAYAAADRLPEAIDTIQKAIVLAQEGQDTAAVEQLTGKLQVYRANYEKSASGKNASGQSH